MRYRITEIKHSPIYVNIYVCIYIWIGVRNRGKIEILALQSAGMVDHSTLSSRKLYVILGSGCFQSFEQVRVSGRRANHTAHICIMYLGCKLIQWSIACCNEYHWSCVDHVADRRVKVCICFRLRIAMMATFTHSDAKTCCLWYQISDGSVLYSSGKSTIIKNCNESFG